MAVGRSRKASPITDRESDLPISPIGLIDPIRSTVPRRLPPTARHLSRITANGKPQTANSETLRAGAGVNGARSLKYSNRIPSRGIGHEDAVLAS